MYFSVRRFGDFLGNSNHPSFPWVQLTILQSGDPAKRARAIVQAVSPTFQLVPFSLLIINKVTHYNNPKILAEVSVDLGEAMVGLTMYEHSSSRSTHFYSPVGRRTATRILRVVVWPSVEIKVDKYLPYKISPGPPLVDRSSGTPSHKAEHLDDLTSLDSEL